MRKNAENAWVAQVPTWPLTLVFIAQFGAIGGAVCKSLVDILYDRKCVLFRQGIVVECRLLLRVPSNEFRILLLNSCEFIVMTLG